LRIDIITLFPEMFSPLEESIIKRARAAGLVSIYLHNLRDYTSDVHRTVDDSPYGGGPGMVMKIEPLYKAITHIQSLHESPARVILMTPQGRMLRQAACKELATMERLLLICGHYEGIDERVAMYLCDDELSIGDYVMTGGELPAMVVVDTLVRLIPGVLREGSAEQESFMEGLLDYPHYTRPREFHGWTVPEVLLSGNHKEIDEWRRKESRAKTATRRPDLMNSPPG
jgi:tRNA (guanine37-N1)-methyltransferase